MCTVHHLSSSNAHQLEKCLHNALLFTESDVNSPDKPVHDTKKKNHLYQ